RGTTSLGPEPRGDARREHRRGSGTRSFVGCDGPPRPVLLRPPDASNLAHRNGPFFRRLTGDCRVNAVGIQATRAVATRTTWYPGESSTRAEGTRHQSGGGGGPDGRGLL